MIFYRPWNNINALTFDLDDTLYNNGPVISNAQNWLFDQLKNHCVQTAHWSQSDWMRMRREVLAENKTLAQDVTLCRQQWLIRGLRINKHPDPIAYTQLLLQGFIERRSQVSLSAEVRQMMLELKQRYRLIAITNGNIDAGIAGFDDLFERVFQAGAGINAKPARQPFDKAAEHLNLPATSIAHVGDHPFYDVHGAIAAGYQAIWLDNGGLKSKLRDLPHLHITDILQLRHFI